MIKLDPEGDFAATTRFATVELSSCESRHLLLQDHLFKLQEALSVETDQVICFMNLSDKGIDSGLRSYASVTR